ncbi:MAG: ferritin [Chitinispirillaceae bacterium]|nr:ferritin [Chitinispirillaceae bacterium]
MLSKKMEQVLNEQVNAEFYSSFLYLSMAAYFESKNLKGFAKWLRIQSEEEYGHAMKIFDYILEKGGRALLMEIKSPPNYWEKPVDVFEKVYEHEKKVTSMINNIMALAEDEKDYATRSMINWFVDEQVEEEANSSYIYETLKMIGDSVNGLFALDHQLGKRDKE